MKIYLVGGAVRDKLLGLSPKERDWVVVGATADEMLKLGYRQVGKDFPVFLHPETKEEYALARTERKIGKGYTGFEFDASPTVTLEEDLIRRDLTINAMAETADGKLIDPYQGKQDLDKKILRHVSQAFVEDPVRILRVARFAARFADFHVAAETNALMQQMVTSGEVDALVAERVWKEFVRALSESHPEKFFMVLADSSALSVLFPQISDQDIEALLNAVRLSPDPEVRFAALMHSLHSAEIQAFCERYRSPTDFRELALLVSRFLSTYQKAKQLNAEELLSLLSSVDAFRREQRFKNFLAACEAASSHSVSEWLFQCCQAAKKVDAKVFVNVGLNGKEIAEKIQQARCESIEKFVQSSLK